MFDLKGLACFLGRSADLLDEAGGKDSCASSEYNEQSCLGYGASLVQMDLRFISGQGFVTSVMFSCLLGFVGVLDCWNEDNSFPQCALPQIATCS